MKDKAGVSNILALLMLLFSVFFFVQMVKADCKYVWVDEDGEVVRNEVCDNVTDTPALDKPSVAPIRQPNVTPIQPIQPRPLGMRECKNAYVYDKDSGRWLNRGVCV